MKKRYFWAIAANWGDGKESLVKDSLFLFRFAYGKDRHDFLESHVATSIKATHAAVRRINRRLAQGERIVFPVEID